MNRCIPVLIFLARSVLAEPALVESSGQWNVSTADRLHIDNSTTLTLPAESLRHIHDGRLILNLEGGGEDLNDDFRKKPRPFFMDQDMPVPALQESWFEEMLERIARILDQPLSKREIKEQQARLDRLEQELRVFREKPSLQRRQSLGEVSEGDVFFQRHPGYQEHHPAHPEAVSAFTVPGIIAAGGGMAKAGGQLPTDKKGGSGRQRGKRVLRADSSGGEGAGNASPGGEGDGKKNRQEGGVKEDKEGCYISKDLEDGTELEAWVDDGLYCSICIDLINESAAQCEGCENYFCRMHIEQGVERCPLCRSQKGYNSLRKAREIKNIKWDCRKHCRASGTEVEMTGHVDKCEGEVVECSCSGCHQQIKRAKIKEHESECGWRPIMLGVYPSVFWKKELVESVDLPQDVTPEAVSRENSAAMAVSILMSLVQAGPVNAGALVSGEEGGVSVSSSDGSEGSCAHLSGDELSEYEGRSDQYSCKRCLEDVVGDKRVHYEQCRASHPYGMGGVVLNCLEGADGPVFTDEESGSARIHILLPALGLRRAIGCRDEHGLPRRIRFKWYGNNVVVEFWCFKSPQETFLKLYREDGKGGEGYRAIAQVVGSGGEVVANFVLYECASVGGRFWVGEGMGVQLLPLDDEESVLKYRGEDCLIRLVRIDN